MSTIKEEKKSREKSLTISLSDVDRLLACADGMSALLYLHMKSSGVLSVSKAARDLRCSADEIERAAETLRRLDLLEIPEPEEEQEKQEEILPQYTASEIAERAKSDSAFEGILFEVQQIFGRTLGANDLRILYGIYDHLALPPEVIYLLINYCVEQYRAAHGQGRTPSMRSVEKEAWRWIHQEIITYEAAEEYILRAKEKQDGIGKVKEALQIRERELTPSERNYVELWIEMGFPPESIAIAYDKTVLRTGKRVWKYMDSILQGWKKQGIFAPSEITDTARPPEKKLPQPVVPVYSGEKEAVANMRKLYESIQREG